VPRASRISPSRPTRIAERISAADERGTGTGTPSTETSTAMVVSSAARTGWNRGSSTAAATAARTIASWSGSTGSG
jgi:hypothetical protein